MRISIYVPEWKAPLSICLPNSILRWKWFWKKCSNHLSPSEQRQVSAALEQVDFFLYACKEYSNTYGSFALVSIQDTDGTNIRITI